MNLHKALGDYRLAVEAACLSAAKFHADAQAAAVAAGKLGPFVSDPPASIVWEGEPPMQEWLDEVAAVAARAKGIAA